MTTASIEHMIDDDNDGRDDDDDDDDECDWCLAHDWVSRPPRSFLIRKLDLTCFLSTNSPQQPPPTHPPMMTHENKTKSCKIWRKNWPFIYNIRIRLCDPS